MNHFNSAPGRTEFSADEDAHIVGDCVKVPMPLQFLTFLVFQDHTNTFFSPVVSVGTPVQHVLRELPSSPVPASCCTALLEAFRKYYV